MPITIPAKSTKYYEKAHEYTEGNLVKTLEEVLKPNENNLYYKGVKSKEAAAEIKALAIRVFSDVAEAKGIKSEMIALRALSGAADKISYVNNNPNQKKYSASEINEAHKVINLAKERSAIYVKLHTASQYASDPYLIVNTYIDYLQARYPKEKDIFEQARHGQKNAPNYLMAGAGRTKTPIDIMEMGSMERISSRISDSILRVREAESRYGDFAGMSDLLYAYAGPMGIADPRNIGKPLAISGSAVAASQQFWGKIKEAESRINVTEEMKADPRYLKAEAYSQFLAGDDMNSLIRLMLGGQDPEGLAARLTDMASTYHRKGLKKKMVEMRKEYKKLLKSEEVLALNEILKEAVNLGTMVDSRRGAAMEREYDAVVKSHAGMFLNKDKEGYTRFQRVVAGLIAYDAAFEALIKMTMLGTKNVAADMIRKERLDIVNEMKEKALGGELYKEYLEKLGSESSAGSGSKRLHGMSTSEIAVFGHKDIADMLGNTKILDISSLSVAEQDAYEKARKKIEEAAAASRNIDSADLFSVIKYGNKALLLQFENLLPAKSRPYIKKSLISQLEAVDVESNDAGEKLERARASLLTMILFESSSAQVTKQVKQTFDPAEYSKVRKALLEGYGKDFEGYTDANWRYINESLKKACSALQGMPFI